jgi:hypothetical protein
MKYNISSLLNGKIEFEREGQIVSYDLNGIEIPIIQRDYAQGRDSSKFIRNRFLDSIFEALSKDEILEMDFVYGSIKEVKDGNSKHNIFLPLDGQQRLTTLFLLYWFLINTEKLDDNQLEKEREVLKRFSYSTRSTARLFCEKLSSIGYNEKVKESIVSSYWFHKNYTKDPTVMGMLITLEDIQEKYNDIQKKEPDNKLMLFNRMDKLCFYILSLDGFALTDELYIKMNARGKALTDFENFKADIINWMKSDKNKNKEEFDKKVMYKEIEIPWYLSIASKFDNSWTDIFWREAKNNKKEDDKIIDPYFLRFIKRFFLNQFIVSSEKKAKDIESSQQFKLLYSVGYEENNKYQSFEDYKEFMEPETLENLEKVLDSFELNQDSIHNVIQPIWDNNDNWLLYNAKITQIQRILFFAVTKYLEHNTYDEEGFKKWIRVTWNVIVDPDIRSIAAMITALKIIDKLSKGSSDIHNSFLVGSFDKLIEETSNIHKNQLIEEKRKIELFNIEGWKDKILEAEAHPLFQGNIGFLLSDSTNIELFLKRYDQASLLFNKNGTNKDYLNEYKVFRYCISQFTIWDEVRDFNYTDDFKNWQLSLRKNESIKKSISELCSLNKKEIEQKITAALKTSSSIIGWKDWDEQRFQLIHYNLYHCLELVTCTQKKNISKIRWRHNLVYFVRPRAHHDKILIDGYRHIVINKFCEKIGIKNNKKCGSSDFIFGEQIEFKIDNSAINWEIIFNGNNKINIHQYNQEQERLSSKTIQNDATDNDKAETVANTIKDLVLTNDPI